MKKYIAYLFYGLVVCCLAACSKDDFLNEKSSSAIVAPKSLTDFQQLLDNTVFSYTAALPQLSADEYEVNYAAWQATSSVTERNAYVWAKDLYGGELNVRDWNVAYTQVFYCNAVLAGLDAGKDGTSADGKYIRGQALFKRAYAFYDLARNFCKAYDGSTAATDAGIPLRTSADIDEIKPRATLEQSYQQIFSDLGKAVTLLPVERNAANLLRPSRAAAYALFARIYLDIRQYSRAEAYADSCLSLYSRLIDYNTVSTTSATPFSTVNDELLYNSMGYAFANSKGYSFTQAATSSAAKIPAGMIGLYTTGDIRLKVFFDKAANGTYTKKRGYYGSGLYPFTGLATDEVYLIKAECLARRGEARASADVLNTLLKKRYTTAAFSPVQAGSADDVLRKVLQERVKELIWRCLRWFDIKRLNMENAQIVLTRDLNGSTYTLEPGSPRYVFPIPDDEIALSGIKQNER